MAFTYLNDLAERLGVAPEQADRMLKTFVQKIWAEVALGGSSSVPGLGTFGKEGRTFTFEPTESFTSAININYAGLESFDLPAPGEPVSESDDAAWPEDALLSGVDPGDDSSLDIFQEPLSTEPELTWPYAASDEPDAPIDPLQSVEDVIDPWAPIPGLQVPPSGPGLLSEEDQDNGWDQEDAGDEPWTPGGDSPGFEWQEPETETPVFPAPDTNVEWSWDQPEPQAPSEPGPEVQDQEWSFDSETSEQEQETPETDWNAAFASFVAETEEPVAHSVDFTAGDDEIEAEPYQEAETDDQAFASPYAPGAFASMPPPVEQVDSDEPRRRSSLLWLVPMVLIGLAGALFFYLRMQDGNRRVELPQPMTNARTAAPVDTTASASPGTAVDSTVTATQEAPAESPAQTSAIDPSAGGWTWVVGSEATLERAQARARQLRDSGVQASILHGDFQGTTRYRIVVGQYPDRQAAVKGRSDAGAIASDAWQMPVRQSFKAY